MENKKKPAYPVILNNDKRIKDKCELRRDINMCQDSPICIDISPIAHVALLHTDINSGFKLVPSMGIKSAERRRAGWSSKRLPTYL